jgi:hypothetical protein
MYDDVTNKENLYGKGFTIYGKIKSELYSELPDKIGNLLKNKFFDKIIYGSIWRCNDYYDLVKQVYNKEDIIFIDGEDEQDRINDIYLGSGKYFKREYNIENNLVLPISFCIPEELIVANMSEKEKKISDIIPNFNKTYNFNSENEYYDEYRKSWYAITKKKGGWDCLRHYEIMMNGCIPIFEDLEMCPKNTMIFLPKKELLDFKESIDYDYTKIIFLLNHLKNNLTTKKMVEHILS